MARSIRLRFSEVESGTVGTIQGYRLQVLAHDAVNMPNEIFVYRVQTVDPDTGEQKASFQNITPARELEELPINGTTVDSPLLFRKDFIDVIFQSLCELNDTRDLIIKDVTQLVATLDKLDDLTVTSDVLIGSDDSSSSSSSSA